MNSLSQTNSRIYYGEMITGWFTDDDLARYRELVSKIHNGVMIELGVYGGLSIFGIIDLLLENHSFAIALDRWGWKGDDFPDGQSDKRKATFAKIVRENHLPIVLLQAESPAIATSFTDDMIDLVFVDANHSEYAVTADLQAWWPKVKHGGVLAGHDYCFNEVSTSLNCFCRKYQAEYTASGNIWQIPKP